MTKLNTFAQIRGLDKARALVLSSALIQRMLPNYLLFCDMMALEHGDSAKNIVNLLWEVSTNKAMKLNVEAQGEKLEEITPNVEDFDNVGVYAALDFCMACSAMLQLISNDEPHGAVMVSKLSQGCVERHIGVLENEDLTGADLKAHPLMQFELESLQWLLSECEQKKLKADDIKALRQAVIEQGVSSLGIEY
ncbi:YjaG family protein [Glaciecola siphonariae]|uniref:YjaG family protein n=1 Tax=Glaciecola siphonariae TaxID=521012 RepID=A0ABV9LWH5_9ALTE